MLDAHAPAAAPAQRAARVPSQCTVIELIRSAVFMRGGGMRDDVDYERR